jgi:LPXTG-motif cell wall-anchored protein
MTCTFSGLEYGQYCLTETSVGSFNGVPVFSGDINASTGVVNVNGSKAVTCTNSKLRGSISVTKAFTNDDTPADGTPFEFTLWEGGVQVQGPLTVYWTSGGSNSVTFTGLDYGHTYTVKETEQSGYINATGDVPVLVDEASEAVTISNTKNIGGLSITKALDSDAGDHTSFQFTIAGPSFPAGGHGFTLEGGQTTSFSDLLYGTYTITETPTAGYELTGISGGGGTQAGNVFTVTLSGENQGFTVTASNRKLGSLTITKAMLDGETVTPVFNFEITGPGGYSDTFQLQLSTDPANPVKASKTFDNLAFGDYTITEIPADGYALAGFACGTGSGSGNSWTVTVGSETRAIGITATNRALGKLEITKKSSYDNAPLGEAVFQVTSVADPSVTFQLTTASTGADKGKVTSGWLVPGDYKVKEITPPDGYAIDDDAEYTVTVNPGMTTSGVEGTVFTDSPGKVMVYKYSSFGRTPVANVRFQLLSEPPDANGDPLPGSMIREQLTNASGVAVFENLMIGHKYWVREIQQAEHYDIDRSIVIEVTAALDPSKVPAARADFTNNPLARVSIVKYDASTVVGGDYSGATKVGGALYGIYDNAACAGAPVATITTSASGPVESVDLKFTTELHTYYVKEITAPAGFLLSDEVQTVDFNTPGQVAALRFSDLRSTGALIIKKTDFTSGDPLAGAKFALYSDEACTVQVGATLTTGADGIARFDNLEPGNYWLVETEAPKDYDKMEGSLPVTVTAGVTAPDPIVITNTYNPPKHYDTGMMDWNFLLLGGMVVLAGLLLVLITRRRRTYVR